MACVVWGFCGILARGRFYFRVVRCLQRGSGALRLGRWKRDVPGRGVKDSGNRGFGWVGDAGAGSLAAAQITCRAVPGRS